MRLESRAAQVTFSEQGLLAALDEYTKNAEVPVAITVTENGVSTTCLGQLDVVVLDRTRKPFHVVVDITAGGNATERQLIMLTRTGNDGWKAHQCVYSTDLNYEVYPETWEELPGFLT